VSVILVFCTCPDAATADRLALHLVEQRLAACVSALPGVRSVYRWQGAIERATEVQLLIKSTRARFDALRDAIVSAHSYELPELIAVEASAGLDRYLDWVGDATRLDPAPSRS
jgi:periplasmic divalent cation tolerance protein